MTIKVLIADDHKLFRQGLIGLMHTHDDSVEVIGEATTGCEAVELVGSLHPDVVLMDIYMPEGDGLQALRQIRDQFPKVHVVMLTSSESADHLYQAVLHGAAGYLLKNLDAEQLFDLLDGVTQGEAAMTREMASRLLKEIATRSADPERGEEPLTQRELTILRLVTVGSSNQDIADQLTISINTVKSRIRSILDKLQLENRTQAAIYAIHHGLVSTMENRNY